MSKQHIKESTIKSNHVDAKEKINTDESLENLSIKQQTRTITINVSTLENVVGMFPVSDTKVTCSYGDKDLGESNVSPVSDDSINIQFSTSFNVNTSNHAEIDRLISTPSILKVFQSRAAFDSKIYQQLILDERQPSRFKSDSIVSIYEGLIGEKQSEHTRNLIKEGGKKKDKKNKKEKEKKVKEKKKDKKKNTSKTSTDATSRGSGIFEVDSNQPRDFYVYGMCTIDFIPLFYGKKIFTEALFIKALEAPKDEKMIPYKQRPKVNISVSVDEELDLNGSIINLTIESIFNIPSLMRGDMDCRICWQFPSSENSRTDPFLLTNPTFTTQTVADSYKCWPDRPRIGEDANTTKYRISPENDEIRCTFEKEIGKYFVEEMPKLQFNMLRRHYFSADTMDEIISHFKTYKHLIVEIFLSQKTKRRNSLTKASSYKIKSYGNLTDESDLLMKKNNKLPHLHLFAIVELTPLLRPGSTRLRTAVQLRTFVYEEAQKIGGLQDSFFIPAGVKQELTKESSAAIPKKEKKEKETSGKSAKASKRSKSTTTTNKDHDLHQQLPTAAEPPPAIEPSLPVFSDDGKPCFIVMEMDLSEPINHKQSVEDVTANFRELLKEQTKEMSTRYVMTSCLSYDYYKEVLNEIIQDMNGKFHRFLQENPSFQVKTYQSAAEFLKFLQNIGAYRLYLNSLTKATSLLATTKFQYENESNDTRSLQKFAGDVFIYLISEMNQVVNKLICHSLEPEQKKSLDSNNKYFFAKEATQIGLFSKAERIFLERICADQKNANNWFDYAVLKMEESETDKALECAQEALLKNPNHRYSLLLLGLLLDAKGQKQEAETVLLNLMVQQPKWLEGWVVLYLFYRTYDMEENMDWASDMVKKYNTQETEQDYFTQFEELAWSVDVCPKTAYFQTAALLLKMRVYDWVDKVCSNEVETNFGAVHYLMGVVGFYRGMYAHALQHLDEATHMLGYDSNVSALTGHCHYALKNFAEAKTEYYYVLESQHPANIHLVYLNCANILENLGDTQEARKLILLACKYNSTPYTWFRAGQLYFLQNDFLSAEECFSESNRLDNSNADTWGYLTLVNLMLNRSNEADLCYQQAIKNKLDNKELMEKIEEEQKAC